MNKTEQFSVDLEIALSELSQDEWAVTKARDLFVDRLEPYEAFEEMTNVLNLAHLQ